MHFLSYKQYTICKQHKTYKYLSILNFKLVVFFAYKNLANYLPCSYLSVIAMHGFPNSNRNCYKFKKSLH